LISAAEAEQAVGIEGYATKGPPCHGRAKSSPADFVVEELAEAGEVSVDEKPGYLPLYRVEKGSIDTLHMAEELSAALRSRVSFGGMKDKKARAVQYVTPTSLRSERPPEVVREKFTATLVGYVPGPLHRGVVQGNRFHVTLRSCCPQIEERVAEAMQAGAARRLPNFYGLQRFGVWGAGTHQVGRAIVKRDFEGAVRLMLFQEHPSDDDQTRAAREAMAAGRYDEGCRLLPQRRDVEKRLARELDRHPGEWVRALRAVPIRLRRLYVQAFQSAIFNRALSKALAKGEDLSSVKPGDNWAEVTGNGLLTSRVMGVRDEPKAGAVPMVQVVGYAFRDYGSRFDACVKRAMEDEGVSPKEFYVEEMQEVSGEGGFRRPHMAVIDASWKVVGDSASLSFTLGRGQYATMLLREVIKPADPAAAGLA
jgi:tRNA pseudouridine13 synthase